MRRLGLIALSFALAFAEPALAASVQSIQGEISVNRGDGFQPLHDGMQLRAGDLVRASQGGSAKLVYADRCVVKVKPGSVIRIGTMSPCQARYRLDCPPKSLSCPSDEGFIENLDEFALGTAAAFIAFCLHTFCDDDDDDGRRGRRPASP